MLNPLHNHHYTNLHDAPSPDSVIVSLSRVNHKSGGTAVAALYIQFGLLVHIVMDFCHKVIILQLERHLSCSAWPVASVTDRVASASAASASSASVTQQLLSRSPARGIMGRRGGHHRGRERGGGVYNYPLTTPWYPSTAHAPTLSSNKLTK